MLTISSTIFRRIFFPNMNTNVYKFPKNVKVGCLMATMSSKTFRRIFFQICGKHFRINFFPNIKE